MHIAAGRTHPEGTDMTEDNGFRGLLTSLPTYLRRDGEPATRPGLTGRP
jgi:hypothetical protein